MTLNLRAAILAFSLATLLFSATSAFAQTGPELARRPWRDEQFIEAETSLMAIFQGGTTSSTYNMARNETKGRFKIPVPDGYRMNVGYEHTFYNIGTDQAGVHQLCIRSSSEGLTAAKRP